MANNNKFGCKTLKNAKVSIVALIILIVMIIFMVLPTVTNAVAKEKVEIEFTSSAVQANTTEFETILPKGNDSYAIRLCAREPLTIDRDAELYTLEEVLYQVSVFDKNAAYQIIKEGDKYTLEVICSHGEDVYVHTELLKVGEEFFICRGEDFRFMMMCAIIGKSV